MADRLMPVLLAMAAKVTPSTSRDRCNSFASSSWIDAVRVIGQICHNVSAPFVCGCKRRAPKGRSRFPTGLGTSFSALPVLSDRRSRRRCRRAAIQPVVMRRRFPASGAYRTLPAARHAPGDEQAGRSGPAAYRLEQMADSLRPPLLDDPAQSGGVQAADGVDLAAGPARSASCPRCSRAGSPRAAPDARSGWSRSPDSGVPASAVLVFVFVQVSALFRFCHRCRRVIVRLRSSSSPIPRTWAHHVAAVVARRGAFQLRASLSGSGGLLYSMAVIVLMFFLGSTCPARTPARLATAMRNLVSRICFFCLPTCAAMVPRPRPPARRSRADRLNYMNLRPPSPTSLDRSLRL